MQVVLPQRGFVFLAFAQVLLPLALPDGIVQERTAKAGSSDDVAAVLAVFRSHCVDCHGRDLAERDLNLEKITDEKPLLKNPALLQKIMHEVEDRVMPPEEGTALEDGERKKLMSGLRRLFHLSVKNQAFPETPIRRMNRFQYNNAVVDLLELKRDIFQMNERLMRRRSNYFDPASRKMPDVVQVSSRPLSKDIDNQRPEGFRGVAPFPQDKRAEHGFDNRGDHLTMSPLLMESFLKLSQTIAESPDLNPAECGSWNDFFAEFGPSAEAAVGQRYEGENPGQLKRVSVSGGPIGPQGMAVFQGDWSNGSQLFWRVPAAKESLVLSWKTGNRVNGIRLGLTRAGDYGEFQVLLDEKSIGKVDLYHPQVRTLVRDFSKLNLSPGVHRLELRCLGKNAKSRGHYFGLDYVELLQDSPVTGKGGTGKKELPSRKEQLRTRIEKLLRRAFRRPADEQTLRRFVEFADQQMEEGKSIEQTMRTVVGAAIGMPEFNYIYEKKNEAEEPSGTHVRVSDFELANRLSQFFWSSLPDDALLDLAEEGTLGQPAVLAGQIERMMNDRKTSRFCDNFPSQWLQLDRLVTSIPDRKKFGYFYYAGYRTSMHMMSEPLLLFDTVFVEDRSVMDLIDPGFTYQNNMLKANYAGNSKAGIEVQVQTFRRVALEDSRRGGVIANAAVMTMTSTPTRTQPITRGAWVNAVIFNDPPEPPPADVPPLPEAKKETLEKLTIRERLAIHRKRADCAGCHDRIDPLGFALENFGPTGVWRDQYTNGRKVDVSGELFRQYGFETFPQFKKIILQQKQRFIRAFAAHLLSYALGRELSPADSPALDVITAKAMAGEDSLRTLMKNIALSDPFLHKR
ncbi:MAG: DUF1592 domain-containing protein [Planctomycetota bacterium]|nr:DUF1592 domain-containing protein [Planctomycetota bacterium]